MMGVTSRLKERFHRILKAVMPYDHHGHTYEQRGLIHEHERGIVHVRLEAIEARLQALADQAKVEGHLHDISPH